MVLGVAWTLRFEILFYILFGVLIVNRIAGVGGLGRMVLGSGGEPGISRPPALAAGPVLRRECSAVLPRYGRGLLAQNSGRSPRPQRLDLDFRAFCCSARVGGGGESCGCSTATATHRTPHIRDSGSHDRARNRGGRPEEPAPDAALPSIAGGRLVLHLPFSSSSFIGIVWQALIATRLDQRIPVPAQFLALASAAIIGGILTSRCVEYPLIRLLRTRPNSGQMRPTTG